MILKALLIARFEFSVDYVVTVCGHAAEHCPIFPAKTRALHVGFEDPPALTKHLLDGEEKLAVYRRVRDQIRRFVERLPEALAQSCNYILPLL